MPAFAIREDKDNGVTWTRIAEGPNHAKRALRQSWFVFGQALKKEANREILHGPKTGRVYFVRARKGGKRRRHRASAPGETHANLSGTLRKSLGWRVVSHTELHFGYGVASRRSNVAPIYAGAIEFGRDDGSIAARPSLLNAVSKIDIQRYFDQELRREFHR